MWSRAADRSAWPAPVHWMEKCVGQDQREPCGSKQVLELASLQIDVEEIEAKAAEENRP